MIVRRCCRRARGLRGAHALLRVSQLYGLGLATLVTRLAPRQTPDAGTPQWFALHVAYVDVASLAAALRVSPRELVAMAPRRCRLNWPCELGLCTRYLEQASLAGEPVTWWRRWTHPLATVCAVHRAWLTPVSTSALRRIRHAGGFGGFATWPGDVEELPVEVPADLVIDALWLQNRCQQRGPVRSAWGSASPVQLVNVAGTLAQLLMSADAGLELPTPRRFGCDGEPVKIFTIEGSGRCSHWTLPGRLRQRQRMLGELGEVLRCGPTATASLPAAVVRQLARSCTKDWPAAALQWICPRAVDVMRHDAELSCAVLPGLHSLD